MYVKKGILMKWKQNFNFFGVETYSLSQIFTAIVSVSFKFSQRIITKWFWKSASFHGN